MDSPGKVEPLILDCGTSPAVDESIELGPCLLCDRQFNLTLTQESEFLKHLLEVHKLIIQDVDSVADLKRYVEHWRPRLLKVPLESVCVKMEDNVDGADVYYYMLCSLLKEDKSLRSRLARENLQRILDIQQREREDNSSDWKCLFCTALFTGNRSLVLNHMRNDHNFNIGHPDNLVNVQTFLGKLQDKLDRLLCLYCEKTFKDRFTLKEHMRKKVHKKLNASNKEYDEFYLINYLERGKDSHSSQVVRRGKGGVVAYVSPGADSDAEDGWQEGAGDGASLESRSVCLFCRHSAVHSSLIFQHMVDAHGFDFALLAKDNELTFYHQVKVINFIRRQILDLNCLRCLEKHSDATRLMEHMTSENHLTSFITEKSNWNQPEFYFPTYENDNLLSGLDCGDELSCTDDWVIPEDAPQLSDSQHQMLGSLLKDIADGPMPITREYGAG